MAQKVNRKSVSPRPSAPYSGGATPDKNMIVGMPIDVYSCDGCGRAIMVEKDAEIAVCPYTDCGYDLYEYSHSGEAINGKASVVIEQQKAIIENIEKRLQFKQERINGLIRESLESHRQSAVLERQKPPYMDLDDKEMTKQERESMIEQMALVEGINRSYYEKFTDVELMENLKKIYGN
ncbi:hypothetical protein AM500_21455 [Bacillus sp. FJAT-18017]|uniref:hypothetical protein n=1 Tax=Bacillus sp. FJAT-18017 TaxID=1705566 RepID=UPI0006AEE6CA|nr:hypothetical protein [Bacillus sp. FJAT-18017]ALC92073.1 hypothetical protein AM500_21455 [Bacillus sp. FJAT-18017]